MYRFFQHQLRYFRNARLQLFIALTGLILGWSCFISIGMFLYKEITYDQFHKKYERIFRVDYNEKTGEVPGHRHMATVGPTVGPALKDYFPEVEAFVRFRYSRDWVVRFNDIQSYENAVWYTDSSVFNVFDFPLKEGDAATALRLPNSVVLTGDMAKKYFGKEDALGKVLTMNNNLYKVTGVLAEIPFNSHIKFDFLLPFHAFRVPYGYPVTLQDWSWISFHNYVLLKPGADAKAIEAQLPKLVKEHFEPQRARKFRFELQPLKDIYFGDAKDEKIAEGNKTYLLVLTLSAFMIILTASFNFANLFTAMSIVRAKETGIRKMLGAGSGKLAWNIRSSAITITVTTLLFSVIILPLWSRFVPWPGAFTQFSFLQLITGLGLLILLAIIVGFLSGMYPSLLLSRYNFQSLLKGSFKVSRNGVALRKSMLAAQFVISITLLCSVLIITRQMDYIKKIDTGFAKDELLLVHMPGDVVAQKFQSFCNKLKENPLISDVSLGGGRLDGFNGSLPVYTESTPPAGEPMNAFSVSFNFFKTTGIPLITGNEFTTDRAYDTTRGVLLNESAVKAFGWKPAEAIGKKIRIGEIVMDGEVMAVVKDFNFTSLHEPVTPLVMYYSRDHNEDVFVRFKGADLSRVISSVSHDWSQVLPALPFDYVFMNDNLAKLYRTDSLFEKMFGFFSIIAIVIACLGLYGLLTQDILYRVKEIAVRRVLGANPWRISFLLLQQYVFLLTIANLVAWPVCYYFMNSWLHEFPYRQAIQWMIFPFAGLLFLIISLLSVIYFTNKAATTNPVKSLKA